MDGHSSNPEDKGTISRDENCGDNVEKALEDLEVQPILWPKNVVNIGNENNFKSERDIIIAPTYYNVVVNPKTEESKPEEIAAIDETQGCKEVELLRKLKGTCESDEENIGTFSALPPNKIQELQSIQDYYGKFTKTDVVLETNYNKTTLTNLNNTGLIKIDFEGPVALVKSKHNLLKEYFMAIQWSRESKSYWGNHLLKLSQDQQLVVSTFMSAFLSKSKNKHAILLDVLANIVPEVLHQEENKLDGLFTLLMEQPRDSLHESGKYEDIIIDGKYFSRNHQDMLTRLNKEANQKLQERDFQNLWDALNDKKSTKNEKSEAKFVLTKIQKGSSSESPTFTIDVEGLRMNPILLTSEAIRSLLWFEDNISGAFEYKNEHHFVCECKLPAPLESRVRSILPLAKSITMIGDKHGDVVVGNYHQDANFVLDEALLDSLLDSTRLQTKHLKMSCIHLPNKKVGQLLASIPNITIKDLNISKEVLEEWAKEIKRRNSMGRNSIGRSLSLEEINLTRGTPESVSIILSSYRYLTLKYTFLDNYHWPSWHDLMASKYEKNQTILEVLKIEGEKSAHIRGTPEKDSKMKYKSKIETDNEDILNKLRMFLSKSHEKNMEERVENCNSDNLISSCEFFMKKLKNQLPDDQKFEDITIDDKQFSSNHQAILEKLIKKAGKKLDVKEFEKLMKTVSEEETFKPKFSLCYHPAKKSESRQWGRNLFQQFGSMTPEYEVDIEKKQWETYPSIELSPGASQSLLWFEKNLSGVFYFNKYIKFKCEKKFPEEMKEDMHKFLKQSCEVEMIGEKTGDVIVTVYKHKGDFNFDKSVLQTLQGLHTDPSSTIRYQQLTKISLSSVGLPEKGVGNLLANIPEVSLTDIVVSPQLMDEWTKTLQEKALIGKRLILEKINLMNAASGSVSWVLASFRVLGLKFLFMTEDQWVRSADEITKAKMQNGLQVLELFSIEGSSIAYLRGEQKGNERWEDYVNKKYMKSITKIQNHVPVYMDPHRRATMETGQTKVRSGWKSWLPWKK